MSKVALFDSTLRDGSQGEGISFSVEDKLKIVRALDALGVQYIEAGNPGSNPKDLQFFERAKDLQLRNATLVSFGSTRRRDSLAKDDVNLQNLVKSNTKVVSIFGKSWDFHVTDIIRTTLEENLAMIEDSVRFIVESGSEVFFDAEHYFDGYVANKEYAVATLQAALDGGASTLVLCETRGGMLPSLVASITGETAKLFPSVPLGIHAHDDIGCGVASSIAAVERGARQVQGTLLGFGERCGNANLASIIAILETKMGHDCLNGVVLENLTPVCRAVSEIANVRIPHGTPFIGRSAFAHKGGMHIDGVQKNPSSFEHIEPTLVGNERRLLMSEVAGRALMTKRIAAIAPDLEKDDPVTITLMDELKRLEAEGYQFEGAESSFDLVIRRHLRLYRPFFTLVHFQTLGSMPYADPLSGATHQAVVKVMVGGESAITAAEGEGPVNALDKALRKVLEQFYPTLKSVHLTDYKVRVLDSGSATASKVRVLIDSTDGQDSWSTIGVSKDIIEASWLALCDSIEYKLIADGITPTDDIE
ncbi:MAG TPA: citramalate synthase [Sphaerochaeta sp.]|nr:citramalate synthase [Sphaerochaeta sp.]